MYIQTTCLFVYRNISQSGGCDISPYSSLIAWVCMHRGFCNKMRQFGLGQDSHWVMPRPHVAVLYLKNSIYEE